MNIYTELYNILETYIFNGQSVVLTSEQTLVCTFIATIGSLFVIALPLVIVYKFMKAWF